MTDAVAFRLAWQDWTAWTETGGVPGRKQPEAHHETFATRGAAEARRAELRQLGRPDLIATIVPVYVLPTPVVRRQEKPRHGKRGRD